MYFKANMVYSFFIQKNYFLLLNYSYNLYLTFVLIKLLEYPVDFYRLFYPKLCGGCDVPLAKGEEYLCFSRRLELPFTNFETIKENPVEKMFHGRVNLEFATSLLFFIQKAKKCKTSCTISNTMNRKNWQFSLVEFLQSVYKIILT